MSEKLPAYAEWLFSTPSWVPALLAAILTASLIWTSWPRDDRAASDQGSLPGAFKAKEVAMSAGVTWAIDEHGAAIKRQFVNSLLSRLYITEEGHLILLLPYDQDVPVKRREIVCSNKGDEYDETFDIVSDRLTVVSIIGANFPCTVSLNVWGA
jgi:hypothetical protein